MEDLGRSLALGNPLAPGEHDEAASPVMTCGMDTCAADVVGCSSERCDVVVQATADPPDLALVLPEMAIQGVKEQTDMELIVVEPDGHSLVEELKVSGAPCTGKSSKEIIPMDADEPLERASPSPWGEFLEELALTVSSSPQNMQMEEAAPSLLGRHSCRLEKNIGCDIPVAKRAEYRRAEAFGEVPKIKSKGKANEAVLNEKMQHYLQMYKKQHTSQEIEAVRAVVEVNA
jgi:hypothetical protein